MDMSRRLSAVIVLAVSAASLARADVRSSMDPRLVPKPTEAACSSLELASTGGPLLKDPKLLAVRWLGFSTFELVYGDQIILLDNYYDRGPRARDLGFKAADVKRANLILVGHAHYDHMSDTAQTIMQTGATAVVAGITASKLLSQGVDPKHVIAASGTDGQTLRFKGFTVLPILARHGDAGALPFTSKFHQAFAEADPATPAEQSADALIEARGSDDPRIGDEGTLAFLITFDDGFRIAYRDSGGAMTAYEKAAMAKVGRVDLLIGAIAANTISAANQAVLMPMVETYRPAVYMPAHHEQEPGLNVDRATEPMFQAIKDRFPDTVTVSKEFREPTCFDTRVNLRKGAHR
jgi:L-ascorbate metabolism protein UlaG (beta-lactamase superfamily)